MAILKCPACKKRTSDAVIHCESCGCEIDETFKWIAGPPTPAELRRDEVDQHESVVDFVVQSEEDRVQPQHASSFLNVAELTERMHHYDESALVEMVSEKRYEFTPEALKIAEDELMNRGYSASAIAELQAWRETTTAERRRRVAEAADLIATLDDDDSACHLCGDAPSTEIPFGLARVVRRRVSGGTALLAILLRLVGASALLWRASLEKRTIQLTLRLCAACAKEKRWLGSWDLTEDDYRNHPAWDHAVSIGFNSFVAGKGLKADEQLSLNH